LRESGLVYLDPLIIRWVSIYVGGSAGIIALVDGSLLGSDGYSTSVIDCSLATQFSGYYSGCVSAPVSVPGDTYGFWNTWVEDKAAVARSIFTW